MAHTRLEARHRMLLGLPEPEPRPVKLSPLHQCVLDRWFESNCLSRRDAVIAAGLSPSSVSLFSRPEVRAEIQRRRDRMDYRQEVTEERIIAEYAKIAYASLGDLLEIQADGSAWIDLASMDDNQKAALSQYDVETYHEQGDDENPGRIVKKSKIRFHDKKAALDSLARIKGMFKDKLEVQVGIVTLAEKVQQRRERLAAARTVTIEGDPVSDGP